VLADGAGGGHAQVGVDVDLAHTVLDALGDLLDRHAVGLAHGAAELVDDLAASPAARGGAVHDQVGVRDARVDLLDALDGEDVAGRRTGELVGAVGGADGDGERVDAGLLDEVGGLFRVGQQLAVTSVPSAPEPSSSPAWPVSSEPRQPSSPSTETPQACAMSTTVG
jgi:hypothetical protein